MAKKPSTTSEHIISIYGHIEGLKREISNIKNNHLKHIHKDIEKIDNKFDNLVFWIVGGVGAIALLFIAQVLYILSN